MMPTLILDLVGIVSVVQILYTTAACQIVAHTYISKSISIVVACNVYVGDGFLSSDAAASGRWRFCHLRIRTKWCATKARLESCVD